MRIEDIDKMIVFTSKMMVETSDNDNMMDSLWYQGQCRAWEDLKYFIQNNGDIDKYIIDENYRNKIIKES